MHQKRIEGQLRPRYQVNWLSCCVLTASTRTDPGFSSLRYCQRRKHETSRDPRHILQVDGTIPLGHSSGIPSPLRYSDVSLSFSESVVVGSTRVEGREKRFPVYILTSQNLQGLGRCRRILRTLCRQTRVSWVPQYFLLFQTQFDDSIDYYCLGPELSTLSQNRSSQMFFYNPPPIRP